MIRIADTGLLKAALDADDQHHQWGSAQLEAHAPFFTCEAVLVELAFLLGTGRPGMLLIDRGDLKVEFNLANERKAIIVILERYADREIDLADACIIRMTELHADSKVWTVDRTDFTIYRRLGRKPVRCVFPPL
jgi:predicted nucleic acid-binding protein